MDSSTSGYVGRFAPSPTGPLHAGSLLAAAASYLDARAHNGQWLLRIEDIDPPREVPGAADDIVRTLRQFGFRWDGEIRYQSNRIEVYRERVDAIDGHTFWCRCSRRDIRTASARTGRRGYPGTCRDLGLTKGVRRFRLDQGRTFSDRFCGQVDAPAGPDDFVLWRRDDLPSYQWAVSIDDIDQGVTHVVRGVDLLHTTTRQIALHHALGAPVPEFAHVPVVVNEAGQKLSKQTGAAALVKERAAQTLCAAFRALGLRDETFDDRLPVDELWSRAIRAWPSTALNPREKISAF